MKLLVLTAALLMLGIASLGDSPTVAQYATDGKTGCPYLDARAGGSVTNNGSAIPETGCPYLDEIHSKAQAGESCPYSGESGVRSERKTQTSSRDLKEI